MASIGFDKGTGWWYIKYLCAPDRRVKKTLAKHPGAWSKSKPPRKPPLAIREMAEPYEEIERQVKRGEIPAQDTLLSDYLRAYISSYALTKRPNSVNCLRNAVEKFLGWAKAKGLETVRSIGTKQCDEWITRRLLEGAERSTVVTERAYLAPIWVQARKHRLITENPWELAKVPGKPKEEDLKYWTMDELGKLFAACEGWVLDYAVLAANTGLRVSALSRLRWRDIDFANNRIMVPAELSKSGRPYSVAMSATANAVLHRRQLADKDGGPNSLVIPSQEKGGVIDRGQIWRRLKAAVKRADIRDFGHYSHALRHSFAVALVSKDVQIRVIQELLGHSSIKTTQIYAKVDPRKAQDVMETFDIPFDDEPKPSE